MEVRITFRDIAGVDQGCFKDSSRMAQGYFNGSGIGQGSLNASHEQDIEERYQGQDTR